MEWFFNWGSLVLIHREQEDRYRIGWEALPAWKTDVRRGEDRSCVWNPFGRGLFRVLAIVVTGLDGEEVRDDVCTEWFEISI